jgi:ribosomal protein L32
MAVPKNRTSKTNTRIRKTIWKKKAEKQASKALSARLSKN